MEKNQDFRSFFRKYKSDFHNTFRASLSDATPGSLDEAAFPAYTHQNPFINWFFWQRIFIVMKYIKGNAPYENVVDFGCGSGVLLPFLAEYSSNVIGADIDLSPLEYVRRQIRFPHHIKIQDLSKNSLNELAPKTVDLITALDVLEHVDDVPSTIDNLLRLLKPEGKIIISGPTENIYYQIGRKIAGKTYSGAYHKRGIAEIQKEAKRKGDVKNIATLYPAIPLFSIFEVSSKGIDN